MMLGHSNPTVHIPPWPSIDDHAAESFSPRHLSDLDASAGDYSPIYLQEAISALQHYFPGDLNSDSDAPVDAYSCDQFRMFEFKVRRCARGRSHDWTECPYAHPGEKARRRDPRKFHYSGTACAEFRKGSCKKGESCEFAHGVFECWLHPARYRTQACKDGLGCRRRVCFFAHAPEELRVLPCQSPRSINSSDSCVESPLRQALEAKSLSLFGSPSEEASSESPPMSPMTQPLSRSLGSGSGSGSIHEMVSSLRNLQLGMVKSIPSSWNVQVGLGSPVYGSPRGSVIRPSFCSLPNTPTQAFTRRAVGNPDFWDTVCEEEPAMERVESGRDLRVRMFEKLSKENPLERVDPGESTGADPDLGWVSELLK